MKDKLQVPHLCSLPQLLVPFPRHVLNPGKLANNCDRVPICSRRVSYAGESGASTMNTGAQSVQHRPYFLSKAPETALAISAVCNLLNASPFTTGQLRSTCMHATAADIKSCSPGVTRARCARKRAFMAGERPVFKYEIKAVFRQGRTRLCIY